MRAISQTLQVTKAMNLISTSKLRKGRRVLEDTEPYFVRIHKSMFDLLSSVEDVHSAFFRNPAPSLSTESDQAKVPLRKPLPGKSSRAAVIVVTSDKGLAGGYNANVIRRAKELCETLDNPVLVLIGNIGYRYFAHTPHIILETFTCRSQLPTLDDATEVSSYVISQFLWGVFDEIYVVYTHMHSTIKLLPTVNQILPLDKKTIQAELSTMGDVKRVDLHFEFLPS